MYKVIASGSKGNAVLYHGSILVDCGVPYALIEPYLNDIQIVLLTHEHKDHFNRSTLKRLADNRPTMRIAFGHWMFDSLVGFNPKMFDIIAPGTLHDYRAFQIATFKLYHDVPNCGYRIYKDGKKIFHATDSGHLEGIEAPGYDLYAIESNYNEETIDAEIHAIEARGEYAYMKGVMNSHLSEQQADEFIYKNKAEHSQILRLHE
jgi:L-ascorbate metabolism protein UlaG (beta-lactamase superfamily)